MLLSLRLWVGQKLFGVVGDRDFPAGVRVGPNRMIKWLCEEPELEGLLYAANNTTIPIPKVYRVHQWHGKLAIEMEYLRGCETLQRCWQQLSKHQKQTIVDQVAAYIQQLRRLEPPKDKQWNISSTNGGPCRDIRVGSVKMFGPFPNSAEFHQCVRGGVPEENVTEIFGPRIMQVHQRDYRTCFTHGDLGVQNILIRDGQVAAVMDWECSGWYPEYWEFTKAHYNRVLLPEFYEMLDQVIERYDEELTAERELWKLLDQPLDELRPVLNSSYLPTNSGMCTLTRVVTSVHGVCLCLFFAAVSPSVPPFRSTACPHPVHCADCTSDKPGWPGRTGTSMHLHKEAVGHIITSARAMT